MNRRGILLLAAAGFILIFALALYNGTQKVEQDLTSRATAALNEKQLEWVVLQVDGRDLVLSGDAPSERAANQALELTRKLEGVNRVSEQFSFLAAEEPAVAPTNADAPWSSTIKAN
ncbi:MAG: BON domain-containing protein [Sedimenticola sp.]|nr:BON domain-containing protein [Sedimenticola sp.]